MGDQDLVPSTHRREVQEYIPAQMYHTMAGSAWLNLIGQHRQQMQALNPHQARAQFLGKNWGQDAWLGRSSWGTLWREVLEDEVEVSFSLHEGILAAHLLGETF